MTSIVLAGGRSSRLGREKADELIEGRTLVDLVLSGVNSLCDEIIIVVSERQSSSRFASCAGAVTVSDFYPDRGSMGGIYTGLMHSSSFHNLVIACDMPFLNLDLLRYMIDLSQGFDAVIPRIGDRKEPLHAIYTKNCMIPMRRLMLDGELKIADLPRFMNARYVEQEEIDRFDPEHLTFFNVNTEEDLERARALASQRNLPGCAPVTEMREGKR